MTSVKFTIKKTSNSDGKHPIVIQLIKDRKNTTISLNKSIPYEDWSFETQRVKSQNKQHKGLNSFITKYHDLLDQQIDDFELRGAPYTIHDLFKIVKSGFSSKKMAPSYTAYQQSIIDDNANTSKRSTNNFYKDTLNSLKRCFGKEDIFFMK